MAVLISTYYSDTQVNARAEVYKADDGSYYIEYFGSDGHLIEQEQHQGKSIYFVEDAAENWALGIKVLKG